MECLRRAAPSATLGAIVVLACGLASAADGDGNTAPERPGVQTIEVYGKAPAERFALENSQRIDAGDLDRLGAVNLSDALQRSVGGVYLAETEDSPFRPDLTYRGFVASPVLGAAQGISVFQDGVRVNEFLGDVVNWDLIPEDAVASATVLPGADARYGRNTLGGSVLLETKRGSTNPGTRLEASTGSFGRRRGLVETGGTSGPLDYFLLGNFLGEDGFRDFSESRVNQVFGHAGWRDAENDLDVTYTMARNDVRGNGFTPESLLAVDRAAVYTQPDVFRPDLDFLNVRERRNFGSRVSAEASFHFRNLAFLESSADSADPADGGGVPLPGVLRVTHGRQRRIGGDVAAEFRGRALGIDHEVSAGVDIDRDDADFRLTEQAGFLNAQRTVIATAPPRPRTDVATGGEATGAFLTDSFSPLPSLTIVPAVRYDRQRLSIDDRLGGAASGDHVFARVDPSIGVEARPTRLVRWFGRYGESFRSPTAVELTCASEQAPCPLPVAFAEDPPLAKVRARTFEIGVRSEPLPAIALDLAYFRTDLEDDILFVAATRSLGFFRNVGRTRRQGLEAFFHGELGPARWFANYSYTRATFETTESLPSPAGDDTVRPGDVIPGVPDHLLKAGVAAPLFWRLRFDTDLLYAGRRYLRTDEANHGPPLSGYVVVNAGLDATFGAVTLFARAENLFDAEYETFGTRGQNAFAGNRVERFLSPGSPLGGWFGVRIDL